jgi:hypothetical protein
MSGIKDVNFQDRGNDALPDLSFDDYQMVVGEDEVKYVPKDRVNYAVLDDEGYPIEDAWADIDQVERDLIGEDDE